MLYLVSYADMNKIVSIIAENQHVDHEITIFDVTDFHNCI